MSETAGVPNFTEVLHPLVQHKLTRMRMKDTSTASFRDLLREISLLLAYELLRDLPIEEVEIETPVATMMAPKLSGKKVCFVSILRAGDGLLQGLLDLVPSARVGHIGLFRDPVTKLPVEYLCKLPDDLTDRVTVLVDPMLATAGSAIEAVRMVKEAGAQDVRFLALVAAPEGARAFHAAHPDVPVFAAKMDACLDARKYIVPGLGDAGDRLFGTKDHRSED
ncbi:uracil phosphoribosyltransferase [Paralimibaculum aggregatum]|uniref:Uracil phosphoribosyltransferase n=1 Tax=Paralimibaculum aggregatum TaxID=3036245 RepID=A0ABQ6LT86_9RHOB|nr:uracil phosphoribosyltransferase [Limibaculum sp. NKW23]GMG85278.1 uracil phosphoribosyltransferase [Limibaculum sp. NKW23]